MAARASSLPTALALLLGVVLILVITPLSQFLTKMSVNADLETATPAAWAVGLVFSLLLAGVALRTLTRRNLLPKKQVALLYVMLTIAVPIMNLGLVRQLFLSMSAVANEYVYLGTSTYRTAYNSQKPEWFPVTPTPEGLAWNKADRLLRLLQDAPLLKERAATEIAVKTALRRASANPAEPFDTAAMVAQLERLGPDALTGLRAALAAEPVERLAGVAASATQLADARTRESAAALATLGERLPAYDELEASLLPRNLRATDRSSLNRIEAELMRLSADARRDLDARVARLAADEATLVPLVSNLSESDYVQLRNRLRDSYQTAYQALPAEQLDAVRWSFVYRLSRSERSKMIMQDGLAGTPNQNFYAFAQSLWHDVARQKARNEQTTLQNLRELWAQLPWHLWTGPLLRWGGLIVLLFLFLMCLAEYLRRKWVDRENLAFPLVEVADNLIRHDFELETSEDPRAPRARAGMFSPLFLLGILISAIVVSAEAAGHHHFSHSPFTMFFDVSRQIFTSGTFKEMSGVVFVLSPVVLGLAFLVNLEVSFSIWASFLIYQVVVLAVKLGNPDIKDSLYTGWAGGRNYPFPMEQMLGACLCFAVILLVKAWKTRQTREDLSNAYLPAGWTRHGLWVLPLLIGMTLWNLGLTHAGFLLFVGVISLALAIASARLRAETGLPTHHVSYEFTKLPLVFGLTGAIGARVYTLFLAVAFLPISLLFRTLPQQLENLELARRYGIRYRTVAGATLLAFVTALGAGMISFLVYSYYFGESFYAADAASPNSFGMARYPLWVAHYLGEFGLDKYTQPHWIRIVFMGIGAGVFGLLMFLRGKFLSFKLHPIGYLAVLLSIYYAWVSPYQRGREGMNVDEVSMLWGSVLVAWLLKRTVIKYGGMNTYKRVKPLFVGLVVGVAVTVFAWNMVDLVCSIRAMGVGTPGPFMKAFLDAGVYSPTVY